MPHIVRAPNDPNLFLVNVGRYSTWVEREDLERLIREAAEMLDLTVNPPPLVHEKVTGSIRVHEPYGQGSHQIPHCLDLMRIFREAFECGLFHAKRTIVDGKPYSTDSCVFEDFQGRLERKGLPFPFSFQPDPPQSSV